jgi:hypothetical protein
MNKLFLIAAISTALYVAALSSCQAISNRKMANKIDNALNKDLDDLLKYIEQPSNFVRKNPK